MSTEASIYTKVKAVGITVAYWPHLDWQVMLQLCSARTAQYQLSTRMSTPNPHWKKQSERESHRWDYDFKGWVWWLVVRFCDGGLSAAGFYVALQGRAEQTDRWALPNTCWTLSIRSAAPSLLLPLSQPQESSSYSQDALTTLCCTREKWTSLFPLSK